MERTVTEDRAKRQKPDEFFYVKSPKGGGMQHNDGRRYDASCNANDATDPAWCCPEVTGTPDAAL